MFLAVKVTTAFDTLTRLERVKIFILEWIHRNQHEQKTYGELFFMFCKNIQNIDLSNALLRLMALFVKHISTLSTNIASFIKSKVSEWMTSQATFIQTLFENISWES